MKTQFPSKSYQGAFTMIEIAISIGVIGLALVAIIGILPQGMNVQKDNREDTIISQDAPYFLNAIRNGEQRTNNNILTGFVESISITNVINNTTTNPPYIYNNPLLIVSATNAVLTNDAAIIGILSTPQYDPRIPNQASYVTATVRAMSGSAMQQPVYNTQSGSSSVNSNTAFRYQLTVENVPWNNFSFNYLGSPNYVESGNQLNAPGEYETSNAIVNPAPNNFINTRMGFMSQSLHDLRLTFAWPVFPNGNVGPGFRTYRTVVTGHLQITNLSVPGPYTPANGFPTSLPPNPFYYYFVPQTYINNPTNS